MPRTFTHKFADATASPQSFAATSRPQERGAMKSRGNLVGLFALGMAGLTWAGISDAAALDYPTRPVRWVVGYPPAAPPTSWRVSSAQQLSEKLGQQFIIENKPGAGNNIGDRGGDQLAARRLHRPARQSCQRHQRVALQEAVVQLHRATSRRSPASRACPMSWRSTQRAGEDRGRVHRLRQGQSGQGQPGVVRQRHIGAPLGRAVHGDDRRAS